MKVVQINAVCGTGSTGRICRELNDALLAQGHQGVVLYGNGTSDYPHGVKVSSRPEVKIHGLLSRLLGKNAAYSPLATFRILRFLRKWKPDVVHLHNLHGNFVNLKPLLHYLAKRDIPTVLTLHDCWFFTGKCTHYTAQGCDRWQTGCRDCPRLRGDIPSWFFDRTGEMWREKRDLFNAIPRLGVIGVSDWITCEARKSFLKDAAILERIYNGIDLDMFYPREKRDREALFTVLCVAAGWTEDSSKTKDLIDLAERLGDSARILLVGNVPFGDKLPGNITCLGYVSAPEELAQLYSNADVYVHLSREDTFGKVIAEALVCGTPAVVYDATACPEVLGEGCGYAVQPGDVAGIAAAIEKLRKQDREPLRKTCAASAAARFEKEKLLADTLGLYERLLEKESL